MAQPVKTKRIYNSPRRQEQAVATRGAILAAAQRLFEEQGYPSTTMEAIATEAGVALKTVYVTFATKSALLRSVWDLALKGDQDEAGVADRPWYQEVMQEPDPERMLRLNARNSRIVKERIGGMLKVIRSAAAVDADSDALWTLIQDDFYNNQRAIVAVLHGKKALRSGMDIDGATDILWTLNHPDVWFLLTGRGWTPQRFEKWFGETASAHLLK